MAVNAQYHEPPGHFVNLHLIGREVRNTADPGMRITTAMLRDVT